jgi:hypothetical protein
LNPTASRKAGRGALAAGGTDPGDLGVGVVEEGLQLLHGERALERVGLGLLGVHGRVPLVDDLDGVRPEPALALCRPVVGRVGQVGAKPPDGHLVAAQRRAPQPAHGAQVGAPLVDHLRRPRPRVRASVDGERPHGALAALHGPGREVAGQLLAAPAVQHRGEHLLLGPQQRQPGDHVQPGRARGEPLVLHRS